MNSNRSDKQINMRGSGQSSSSNFVLNDVRRFNTLGSKEGRPGSVRNAPIETYIETCLHISPRQKMVARQKTAELLTNPSPRQKRLARQRPAELVSPRRSFCDFLNLDLEPKKTRKESNAHKYTERKKESPALLAMKAKLAFIKACHAGNFQAVQKLVTEYGVSVNQQCMALHFASDANYHEIVQFLLSQGADVNCKDPKNRTALMYAAYKNNVDTVQVLLERGTDLEIQDDFGSTALMYAASGGSNECCRLLVEHGANLDMQNKDGLCSLIYAIQSRKNATLKVLLELGANPYITNCLGTGALHWAAKKGEVECCASLIEHGVNVDTPNNKKVTPLMYAADCVPRNGSNVRVMKFLIDSGADVQALDEDHSSPLMYAAHSGSEGNVDLLIECGADPSCQNEFGTTPIMYAAYYGHLRAFVSFVKHDPSLRLGKDKRGMTVRSWASQTKQDLIIELLDRMDKFPIDWKPELHARFPQEIQDKVKAVLLAAQSPENPFLKNMPQEIILKIIGQYAKFETWPILAT